VGLWDSESRAGLAAWAFLVVMRHTLEQPPQGDGTGFFHFGGDLHANRGRSRSGAAAVLLRCCCTAAPSLQRCCKCCRAAAAPGRRLRRPVERRGGAEGFAVPAKVG